MSNIIAGTNFTPVCLDRFSYYEQSLNTEDPTLWMPPSLIERVKRAFGFGTPDFFQEPKNIEWSLCSEIAQMNEKSLSEYSIADVSFLRKRSVRYHQQAESLDQKTLEIFDKGLKNIESYKFPYRIEYEIEKKADELKGDVLSDEWYRISEIYHREVYNLVISIETHLLQKNANKVNSGMYGVTYFNWVKDKKQLLPEVMEEFEQKALEAENFLKLLEPIKWIHGTNSGIFATLPGTDQRLENIGDLLKKGIVPPNSGELDVGAALNGVNRNGLSGVSVQFFSTAWNYAYSYQSNVDDMAQRLAKKLEQQTFTIKTFDMLMIPLLRLRQWDDEQYKTSFQEKAVKHIQNMRAQLLSGLNEVTKAIDYEGPFSDEAIEAEFGKSAENLLFVGYGAHIFNEPEYEEIVWRSAVQNNECNSFISGILKAGRNGVDITEGKKRLRAYVQGYIDLINNRLDEMLKQASSEQPALKIKGERDRSWVKKPFPIILASTNIRASYMPGASTNDYIYSGAPVLGKEIDLIFTQTEHQDDVRAYLETHGLQDKVKVYAPLPSLPIPVIGRSEDRDINV